MKHSNNQVGSDSSNSILKGIKQKLDIMYLSRTIDFAKNLFSKSLKKLSISADCNNGYEKKKKKKKKKKA